jgi:acid stress-induced BolA-like protein IbaG/YrbA
LFAHSDGNEYFNIVVCYEYEHDPTVAKQKTYYNVINNNEKIYIKMELTIYIKNKKTATYCNQNE